MQQNSVASKQILYEYNPWNSLQFKFNEFFAVAVTLEFRVFQSWVYDGIKRSVGYQKLHHCTVERWTSAMNRRQWAKFTEWFNVLMFHIFFWQDKLFTVYSRSWYSKTKHYLSIFLCCEHKTGSLWELHILAREIFQRIFTKNYSNTEKAIDIILRMKRTISLWNANEMHSPAYTHSFIVHLLK